MKVFFSVGEPSGDEHAAGLIEELRTRCPGLVATGFGGPKMRPLIEDSGGQLVHPLTELAVMGFTRVVPMLGQFYRLVQQAEAIFREDPPDAVVLVDFPGFNWWIARKAHAAGIPVFYYMPPQLWAWAPWRIAKIRRFVDHVLCSLPFEYDWYTSRGVSAEYVGHPFFDEVAAKQLDSDFLATCQNTAGATVAILPGSRTQEVTLNWPVIQQVLNRLARKHPSTRFLVANYQTSQRRHCEARFLAAGSARVEFHVGRTSEIIEAADCCLMVSGSVSLELLARKTPAVVIYRATRLVEFLTRRLVSCQYMSLPNLLVDDELLPEFPFSGRIEPWIDPITSTLDDWLSSPDSLDSMIDRMTTLHQSIGAAGANGRTAEAILGRLPGQALTRAA